MSFCVNCFSDTKGEEICPYCGYAGEELQDRAILKPGTILNDKYILGSKMEPMT